MTWILREVRMSKDECYETNDKWWRRWKEVERKGKGKIDR